MRSLISLMGVLLILLGIAALGYQGFTYTKHEEIAKIGDLKITADTERTIHFPPALGGLSLAAGIVLVIIGRMGSRK